MRHLVVLVTYFCAIICASSTYANRMADSVAFQGRLTDASDVAVPDGPRDLTLSLWTDSVGGTMLHSEVVVVTVSKGLYSTCIGCASSSFFDVFTDQSVYLQVQLAGSPPMTPRTPMRSSPFSISSSSVHSEAGNGTARARGMVIAKPGSVNPHARVLLDVDSDDDGNPEYVVLDSVSTDGSSRVMSKDSDDDGGSDGDISFSMTPTTSSVAIKQKGTGADKDRVVIQTTQLGLNPGTSMVMSRDHDDDGLMDRNITTVTDDTGARMAIKTKGTGAQRFTAGTDCDDTDASTYLDCDDDGDGVAESSISSISNSEGASLSVNNINGGMPNRISMNVTVAKQTQGATFGERCDMNNDGLDETATTLSTDSGGTALAMEVKLDNTPARLSTNMTIERQTQKADFGTRCYVDGDNDPESEISQSVTPTTSSVAIKTKGTGADANRLVLVSGSTGTSSAVHGCEIDDDGDGIPETSVSQSVTLDAASQLTTAGSKNIGLYVNEVSGQCNLTMTDASLGTNDTTIIIDGKTKRFGIGISQPDYPLHHSSGAHLTDGGVWTNASDANLKENFQVVDGDQLLEQLDQLPISQWNYKNESDEVTHIGPTAQDFQKVFNVGENDKTISTIDPSGIALAAIKELNKQNRELKEQSQELKEQNALLKKQLEELSRKVNQLVSNK